MLCMRGLHFQAFPLKFNEKINDSSLIHVVCDFFADSSVTFPDRPRLLVAQSTSRLASSSSKGIKNEAGKRAQGQLRHRPPTIGRRMQSAIKWEGDKEAKSVGWKSPSVIRLWNSKLTGGGGSSGQSRPLSVGFPGKKPQQREKKTNEKN